MRRSAHWTLLLLGVGFALGLIWIFSLRFETGDAFPAYSTLRADPLGTRAFYEALNEFGTVRVARHWKAIEKLPTDANATYFVFGVDRTQWETWTEQQLTVIEESLRKGAQVVLLFHGTDASVTESKKESRRVDAKAADGTASHAPTSKRKQLGFTLIYDGSTQRRAERATSVPGFSGPQSIPWHSGQTLNLSDDAQWRVLYNRDDSPVLAERNVGAGKLIVGTDSYLVSNEGLLNDRTLSLLVHLLGDKSQVYWVESHLGVREDPGIASLARRYGLAGGVAAWAAFALLFIWRRSSPLVPAQPREVTTPLHYHPAAGLALLLRRSVPSPRILSSAIQEWERHAAEDDKARLRKAVGENPDLSPFSNYNKAVQALRRRNLK